MISNGNPMKILRGGLTIFVKVYETVQSVNSSCYFFYARWKRRIQAIRRRRIEDEIWKKLNELQDILHLPLARCVRTHYQISCARSASDVSSALASLNVLLAIEQDKKEWSRVAESILDLYGNIPQVKVYRRQSIQHHSKIKNRIPIELS